MEMNPQDYKSELNSVKDSLKKGASTVKRNIEDGMSSAGWQERFEDVQEGTRKAVDASEDFIRSHPYYTALGAATVGFVAGMLSRRH